MDRKFPQRRDMRLKSYDYSQPGYYFVTICTAARHQDILCTLVPIVGAIINRPPVQVALTALGRLVEQAILDLPAHYPAVTVDTYVIMPDHIHLILNIDGTGVDGRQIAAPTSLSTVVQQFKRAVSLAAGRPIWQKSYYDHVIRGDADLDETRRYIQNNPAVVPR